MMNRFEQCFSISDVFFELASIVFLCHCKKKILFFVENLSCHMRSKECDSSSTVDLDIGNGK